MKTRTIKSILSKKHKQWVESIEDEHVKKVAKEGTFITGGAVASLLDTGEINDIDIYFKDTYSAIVITEYYLGKWEGRQDLELRVVHTSEHLLVSKLGEGEDSTYTAGVVKYKMHGGDKEAVIVKIPSEGVAEVKGLEDDPEEEDTLEIADDVITDGEHARDEKPKHRPVFITDNAITLTGKVQLVLRFVGGPSDIHENFDFIHCTCWYDPKNGELGLPKEAMVSLMTKELMYTGSKYPLCSLFRMRKFIDRGFTINAGQILKMVFQLQELDLKDSNVLREQLIGVDTTYMRGFIKAYNKWLEENDNKEPSLNYLTELVDKVFSDKII